MEIAPFTVDLTGSTQTVQTTVGAWSVTDDSGTDEAENGPVSSSKLTLGTAAATIATAAPGTGQGAWDFPEAAASLEIVVPGDASAGEFSSTLTFTTAPPAL